ncbi:ferredoxin [Actinosynnema sp. NPDC020468]|uniref:ferredoxin n=1 Tax=Actinosynnema sp. NPDC020468 TaxID=3154488 RepID=UPI0033C22C77
MKLGVDPVACRGNGSCADLLAELIDLDEWGYPLLSPDDVPAHLVREAKGAVSACPALALKLRR